MRKPYEKPALRPAGDLAAVTRGATLAIAYDGLIFHRGSTGGGGS